MSQKNRKRDKPQRKQEPQKETRPEPSPPAMHRTESGEVSPAHEPANQQELDLVPDPDPRRKAWRRRAIYSWITTDRIMAAFTVLIGIATVLQWEVYRSQLTEMRIGQRPWLKVKFVSPMQLAVNQGVCSQIVMTNTGKTPAKHVRAVVKIKSLDASEAIDFSLPEPPSNATPLTPPPVGSYYYMGLGALFPDDPLPAQGFCMIESIQPPKQVPWTQAMEKAFNAGEIYIETHGQVTYDDSESNPHWTRFCFVNSSPEKPVSVQISRSCAAYNAVDEN